MPIKTIVIKSGEKAILPHGAIIRSVVLDGAANVESSCGNLPTPTAYKCGYFIYVRDNDTNDTHPMDETRVTIKRLFIGDDVYDLNVSGNVPTTTELNQRLPNLSLFSFTAVVDSGIKYDKRKYFALYFKAPAYVFNLLKLEIVEKEGVAKFFAIPVEYECGQYDFSF